MLAALVPAYAIAILVPAGPDDGCPSPRQVSEALAAHLSAVVLPLGHAAGPSALRLAVTTDSAGAMRLDLSDPDGAPLLHRWLPAVEHGHVGDCPALAETAALIVERYWHEVGYDVPIETPTPPPAPPPRPPPRPEEATPPVVEIRAPSPRAPVAAAPLPPPPPPRWWIAPGVAGRIGDSGKREGAASIAFTVERPIRERRVGLRLSTSADAYYAYSWPASGASPAGHATLRQFPVRMGGYLAIPLGLGQLEPGLGVDLDVISAAVSDASGSRTRLSASPGVDLAVAWALRFRHNIFLRALGEAGTEVPYEFVTTVNQRPFWSTPRLYLDLGLELGLWFP